jgi:hypothetical protein
MALDLFTTESRLVPAVNSKYRCKTRGTNPSYFNILSTYWSLMPQWLYNAPFVVDIGAPLVSLLLDVPVASNEPHAVVVEEDERLLPSLLSCPSVVS